MPCNKLIACIVAIDYTNTATYLLKRTGNKSAFLHGYSRHVDRCTIYSLMLDRRTCQIDCADLYIDSYLYDQS